MTVNCFLCNDCIKECSTIAIYYTVTTHSNTLLVDFIKKNLHCDLNKPHPKYICKECWNLFEELDFAELTCTRLRRQILERWILNEYDSLTKDATIQTDNFESCNIEFKETSDHILSLETIKQETGELVSDTDIFKSHTTTADNSKTGTKKKVHECEVCQKKYATKNGMELHVRRKHGSKSSSLDVESNLENAVKEDCDIKEIPKSENEFQLENELDDECSNSSSRNSNTCNKKIKAKKKCTAIIVRPLKYQCPQCQKMWRTMGELRSHMSSHNTLRPYICEVCGQAYKHKAALDIHVGMHNGINPFSCKYCHKSFTQKGALQRHLPIHTGEAPYQCDLCGKRFVHHTSFNMHTLAHTGQKSYKCTICGLALLSGSHLKRHMRVHTGERPYACVQCGKRFAERYNLAAHQRLHEAGPSEVSKRLYRCQVCGAGFDRRPKLEEHLSNNHNKISENDPSRKWVGHFLTNS